MILAYFAVFLLSSWGSRFIMRKRGYPMPQGFSTKVDRILAVMHLLWFIILNMLGFSLLLAFGIEPF
jgi:hypothetical protein